MTVYKLVAAAKVHLCNLTKSITKVLDNQEAEAKSTAEQFDVVHLNQDITIRKQVEQDARLLAIEAALARIEDAVIEPDVAGGIRLTVQAFPK